MLAPNSIFEQTLKVLRPIGQGGMGTVYLAQDLADGSLWAIKEQEITAANRDLVTSEADILSRLSHPAFPGFRFQKQVGQTIYLVMEYVDGCTLEDLIHSGKKFPEDVVAGWFIQICRAIVYLHSLTPPIVYRDFKPSNIMLDRNGTIRIIDLGIAQEYRTPRIGRQVNALTRGYAAPEQYNSRYSLDVRTDLYAVAVTIHYLLTGKDPNQPPYHFRPVRKLNPRVSLAMESIVKRCLQPNPDKRYPTAALLLEDLTHRDRLEQQLLTRRRWRAILIAVLTALALVGAALAFTISRTAREAEITAYYEYLDQADAASSMEKSLALLQQAVESDPDNPDAYLAIAALYLRQGLREESARYLQEEILPRFPDIYQNEAFLELVGELDTAD